MVCRAYHQTYGAYIMYTRFANAYGPYQYPEKLLSLAATHALDDKPLPLYGDGKYRRNWIYIDDICRAIDLIIQKGKSGQAYNIGSGEERTNLEVVREILALAGKPETLLRHVKDRPGHDRRYALDHGKLRRELGFAPRIPLAEGLREVVRWYREHEAWWQEILSGDYQRYYAEQYGER